MKSKLAAPKVHYLTAFAFGFIFSVLFTLDMVYFVQVVALDPLQMVLVGTVLEGTIFLFEIPTGVVADVYSRRLSTIIGVFLLGLGFIIEGLVPAFGVILLAQVVWGFGWTFISGARSAWITDEVGPDHVAPVYLRASQLNSLGGLLGIPVSVMLGGVALNLPIVAGGGLMLLLGVMLVLVMPEQGFQPLPPAERQTWHAMLNTFREGTNLVRKRPSLITFLVIGLFVGLYSEGFDRLWTPHFLENFQFPAVADLSTETWFGILRAVALLLSIAAAGLVNRRNDDTDLKATSRLLQLVFGGMALALLMFALTRNVGLAMAGFWIFSALRHISYPLSEAWVNRHIDSKVRATVLSMTSQVDAIGQIAGGPGIGFIGKVASVRVAIAAAAVILAPVVPLYGRAKNSTPADDE